MIDDRQLDIVLRKTYRELKRNPEIVKSFEAYYNMIVNEYKVPPYVLLPLFYNLGKASK